MQHCTPNYTSYNDDKSDKFSINASKDDKYSIPILAYLLVNMLFI